MAGHLLCRTASSHQKRSPLITRGRSGASAFVLICSLVVASRGEAAIRTVCASGCAYTDPQAAIDAASYGDIILLRAGETFVGHFRLRAKPGTGVIVIRGDAPASELPGDGVRLVPSTRPDGNTA